MHWDKKGRSKNGKPIGWIVHAMVTAEQRNQESNGSQYGVNREFIQACVLLFETNKYSTFFSSLIASNFFFFTCSAY